MAQNSFALMTNLGRAKEAAALANGTAVVITHIAIGDGTTVPSGGETALYNEIARKAISGHGTVVGASNVAYFDIFLAAAEGPYTIREAGLYDNVGDLIAIARYDPPINKPVPASGQTVEGTVRLEVAFSNLANVTIVVDPSFTVPLQRLSHLPWIPVISMSIATPPSSPSVGDAYLIPAGATGSWAGQSGRIAEYTAAGWGIITPQNGHGISLPDGRVFERIDGSYIEKIALDVQSGKWNVATATGTANALAVALTPAPSAYSDGLIVAVRPSATTTSVNPTINVNGLGAKAITNPNGTALAVGALKAGALILLIYNSSTEKFNVITSDRQPGQAVAVSVNGSNYDIPFAAYVETLIKVNATLLYDTNNAYSLANGTYTVPEAGVYAFSANISFDAPSNSLARLWLRKNNSKLGESSSVGARVLALSVNVRCEVGDVISITGDSSIAYTKPAMSANSYWASSFSGALLGK